VRLSITISFAATVCFAACCSASDGNLLEAIQREPASLVGRWGDAQNPDSSAGRVQSYAASAGSLLQPVSAGSRQANVCTWRKGTTAPAPGGGF
jgi:hypothetical protein